MENSQFNINTFNMLNINTFILSQSTQKDFIVLSGLSVRSSAVKLQFFPLQCDYLYKKRGLLSKESVVLRRSGVLRANLVLGTGLMM